VTEVGTNFNAGAYDDLPENKASISLHDVGLGPLALLCGKKIPAAATTTISFNDLNNANIDIIRQIADPLGNIFRSEVMTDHVIESYDASFKVKSASTESVSLVGFNTGAFRGIIQTKCYIVQSADASAKAFTIAPLLGPNEAVVPIPTPGSIQSGWIASGRINFVKIERWRPSDGFTRFREVTSAPTVLGTCKFTSPSLAFATGDIATGDVFFLTYNTFTTDATSLSALSGITGRSFKLIPQTTLDTSDPASISTRLTPVTIAANNVSRGQGVDFKFGLKRERVEGIGDTEGMFGPSDAPSLSVSFDGRYTDAGLDGIMMSGSPYGSDYGGSATNDWFDPNLATRNQIATPIATVVTVYDPRSASTVLKTVTAPACVYGSRSISTPAKGAATIKWDGIDVTGNLTLSVTKP
jgi:hypothetical protein